MYKKIIIIVCISISLIVGLYFCIDFYCEYKIAYMNVYVASHNISQRKQIIDEDLILVKIPKDYLNEDVITKKEDIIGKYVKLSYSIPKGSFIYKNAVENDIKDLANTLLNNNEVNYDLFTSDIKINTANLSKNMYIDLYLTIKDKDNTISDLLLSNLRITGLYDPNNKLILDYDDNSKVYIISLAINSEYVAILNKAQVLGQLHSVVSSNAYNTNLKSILNTESKLMDYLN